MRRSGGQRAVPRKFEKGKEDILNQLRELQVDLRSNPAVFIGGGSILLRPFLINSPLVAKADFVESPNANALGYEMLGRKTLSLRPLG